MLHCVRTMSLCSVKLVVHTEVLKMFGGRVDIFSQLFDATRCAENNPNYFATMPHDLRDLLYDFVVI